MTSPKALVVGAGGFIGRHVAAALEACGWRVLRGISPRGYARLSGGLSGGLSGDRGDAIAVDYACDNASDWCRRLQSTPVDVVINAVGVLRDSRARPIEATHHTGPVALFNACAQSGTVRRVIQISALGVEGNNTRYASTKRAADTHLLALADKGSISAVVLRPSVVFGKGGASSQLFMNLARLPVLCLPGPVLQARVQPVAVTDLAQAVSALVQAQTEAGHIIECTGPEALSLAALIASLRQQCGHRAAWVLRLPDALSVLSARVGDYIPASPWCSESLALLGQDNVGDAAALRALLERDAVHYSQLVEKLWRH